MNDPDEPVEVLRRVLGIGADLAWKLVDGHLGTIEEVAYVPFEELKEVSALSETQTTELRETARRHLLSFWRP